VKANILGALVLSSAMTLVAGAVSAKEFKVGAVNLAVDTTVSMGASMRASGRDCAHVGLENGGCLTEKGTNWSANGDDGNLNFDSGDLVSAVVKVTTDFEARYENFGGFMRVKAFYDQVNYNNATGRTRPVQDSTRGDVARNSAGRGLDVLDAFVFGNFTVAGDLPLSIRLGKQVNNWGESLFIGGGINSYLPYDVTALRTPGSELKEAVLPELALYASLGLPNNFSIEGFYVLEHETTQLDSCGTFFASTDVVHEGCSYTMNGAEYNDAAAQAGLYNVPVTSGGLGGVLIPRYDDHDAKDEGQFGLSLRYFAENFNGGTDFGLFFTNFHSKAPYISYTTPEAASIYGSNWADICANLGGTSAADCFTNSAISDVAILEGASSMNYGLAYAEDIRMFGASFNTLIDVLGGTALAGEIAYSPNMAFQRDTYDILSNNTDLNMTSALGDYYDLNPGASIVDLQNHAATLTAGPYATTANNLTPYGGNFITPWKREEVITGQFQTTSTLSASDPVVAALGADLLILLSNAGFQYLPNVTQETRLATAASGAIHADKWVNNLLLSGRQANNAGEGAARYADKFSWGYRLVAVANYNNAFRTPWTLSPSIQWRHDVDGLSAGPNGPGFIERAKTISLGLGADYQGVYKAKLSYTNNFGNPFRNSSTDKDFVSFNVSYAF